MAECRTIDIMIVGAGPAGTSTWLHLQKHAPGLADQAILIDRAVFPRPKLCGGGLWAWGEDILTGLDIDVSTLGRLRSEVVFRFRDRRWVYRSPRPFRMVPRADFDTVLVEAALARGASLRQGEGFVAAHRKGDGLEVQTSRGCYRLKTLVGADGSLSAVRRAMMGAGPSCLAPAMQVSAPADGEDDQAPLQIDFSAVAEGLQGYVWHFPGLQNGMPVMHHGIVDFRIHRERARADMHTLFRRALHRRHLTVEANAWFRHPIRWLARNMPVARPHVLLAGDAAGIEPALGGGLHLALSYGALAAAMIQEAFDKRDFSFQGYPAALQAHVLGQHIADFTRLAQTIYSGPKNPLDAVRDFFTDRLMRSKLSSLLRGRVDIESAGFKKSNGFRKPRVERPRTAMHLLGKPADNTPSVLLIHPPVAKPCEPPAGVARLAGVLQAAGVDGRVYDASLDGILALLAEPVPAEDTWSRRAVKHRAANLSALRGPDLYRNRDRYKRAVLEVNRLLHLAGRSAGVHLSLSDCGSAHLSPQRSGDLIRAAEGFADNPFYPVFSRRLTRLFDDREPDLVGLSLNFTSQALCAFAIIGWVRAQLPAATIMLGGGLVTSWMHIPGFRNPFQGLVDELVCGPGEQVLLERCGAERPTGGVAGGCDFAAFDHHRYLAPEPVLPLSTSRGCYWRQCAFCPEKSERAAYRPMRPAAVGTALQDGAAEVAPGLVHFLDNALAPKLLAHLAAHPPGVPWYGFVRVSRHLADPDFARGLRAAGCVMLKLGVESGDQAVLDALGKGVDLATVSAVLRTLKAAGIATYVYLLFGTPAETRQAARRTLDFTLAHAAAIDFLNLAVFNLPAHSEEAALLETRPFFDGDLSLYRDFVHPAGWQREHVRRFLSKEFRRAAPIRRILANDPPYFTSNHAPFFGLFRAGSGRQGSGTHAD